jgi:hypothetical protein
MISRSKLLRTAWASYRAQIARVDPGRPFSRKLFAHHLSSAWRDAKGAVAYAARCAAEANVPLHIRELRSELLSMELGERIDWARHRELKLELFRASVALGSTAA